MMSGFPEKQRHYTYEDYLKWDDNIRCELIDGIPYLLASPSISHQLIVGNIYVKFREYLNDKSYKVFAAPLDVLLPQNDNTEEKDIDVVVQPDVFVVCDENKIKNGKNCNGAPDLVIEVLSPATASRDFIKKQILYEKAGVKEYWIVSPDEKNIVVFRMNEYMKYDIHGMYTEHSIIKAGMFPDIEISLKDIFV